MKNGSPKNRVRLPQSLRCKKTTKTPYEKLAGATAKLLIKNSKEKHSKIRKLVKYFRKKIRHANLNFEINKLAGKNKGIGLHHVDICEELGIIKAALLNGDNLKRDTEKYAEKLQTSIQHLLKVDRKFCNVESLLQALTKKLHTLRLYRKIYSINETKYFYDFIYWILYCYFRFEKDIGYDDAVKLIAKVITLFEDKENIEKTDGDFLERQVGRVKRQLNRIMKQERIERKSSSAIKISSSYGKHRSRELSDNEAEQLKVRLEISRDDAIDRLYGKIDWLTLVKVSNQSHCDFKVMLDIARDLSSI